MRPGQNRRMRGRNRNKGPNPLTRAYESNGPDVKIRGTAQHIADKYAQLARDAQVSSDPVAAENYFQHAEHYYRIIAAAQEQYRQQYGGTFQRPNFDEDGEEGDDDGQGYGEPRQGPAGYGQDEDGDQGGVPQPYEGQERGGPEREGQDRGGQDRGQDRGGQDRGGYEPRRVERRDDRRGYQNQGRNDRQDYRRFEGQRQDGPRQDGSRQDGPRQDGPRYDGNRQEGGRQDYARQDYPRQDNPRQDNPRQDNPRRDERRQDMPRQDVPRQDAMRFEGPRPGEGRDEGVARPDFRRERASRNEALDDEAAGGLPAFLTAPVRGPAPAEGAAEEAPSAAEGAEVNGSHYAPRPRRRRRARYEGPAAEAAGEGGEFSPPDGTNAAE